MIVIVRIATTFIVCGWRGQKVHARCFAYALKDVKNCLDVFGFMHSAFLTFPMTQHHQACFCKVPYPSRGYQIGTLAAQADGLCYSVYMIDCINQVLESTLQEVIQNVLCLSKCVLSCAGDVLS